MTARELEILRLVAAGALERRIARELCVTEQTVKFHLSNVYRKLGVANRTEASHYAHVHGLLELARATPAARAAAARRHEAGSPTRKARQTHPDQRSWRAPRTAPPGCSRAFRRSTSLDESEIVPPPRRARRGRAPSRATARRCATSTSSTPTTSTATSRSILRDEHEAEDITQQSSRS